MQIYRCRKCRQDLEVQSAVIKEIDGCTEWNNLSQSSELYLDIDSSPTWIVESVKQTGWIKGKLICVKCKGRLGSFDFVNQKQCRCKQHAMPSLHLLKSRIDEIQKRDSVSPSRRRPSYPKNTSGWTKYTQFAPISSSGSGQVTGEIQRTNCDMETVAESINASGVSGEVDSGSHRQIFETCCGQVDSFHDQDNPRIPKLASDSDGSNNSVLDFNIFDVLPVEEIESDSKDEKAIPKSENIEDEVPDIPPELTCAICLEMFCRPRRCKPCGHTFCEHCLRQVSRQTPVLTKCPLCRNVIRNCVYQEDLAERIKTEYENHNKERLQETRKMRKETYPLPGCTPDQYERYLQGRHMYRPRFAHRNEHRIIIVGCFQEILVRFAWLLLLFILHNILSRFESWFGWDVYSRNFVNFNYFLLTLTCKLVLFGTVYCLMKYFYINFHGQFMGQAILFVFICSVLWDSHSWIHCALNMIVLGSLFL